MDGLSDNSGIIVIAATNQEKVLDPALIRPGRFDRKLKVGKPGLVERKEILAVILRSRNHLLSSEEVDLIAMVC